VITAAAPSLGCEQSEPLDRVIEVADVDSVPANLDPLVRDVQTRIDDGAAPVP
jgi:hypothetical protein